MLRANRLRRNRVIRFETLEQRQLLTITALAVFPPAAVAGSTIPAGTLVAKFFDSNYLNGFLGWRGHLR